MSGPMVATTFTCDVGVAFMRSTSGRAEMLLTVWSVVSRTGACGSGPFNGTIGAVGGAGGRSRAGGDWPRVLDVGRVLSEKVSLTRSSTSWPSRPQPSEFRARVPSNSPQVHRRIGASMPWASQPCVQSNRGGIASESGHARAKLNMSPSPPTPLPQSPQSRERGARIVTLSRLRERVVANQPGEVLDRYTLGARSS
jgi:hypothetical protein